MPNFATQLYSVQHAILADLFGRLRFEQGQAIAGFSQAGDIAMLRDRSGISDWQIERDDSAGAAQATWQVRLSAGQWHALALALDTAARGLDPVLRRMIAFIDYKPGGLHQLARPDALPDWPAFARDMIVLPEQAFLILLGDLYQCRYRASAIPDLAAISAGEPWATRWPGYRLAAGGKRWVACGRAYWNEKVFWLSRVVAEHRLLLAKISIDEIVHGLPDHALVLRQLLAAQRPNGRFSIMLADMHRALEAAPAATPAEQAALHRQAMEQLASFRDGTGQGTRGCALYHACPRPELPAVTRSPAKPSASSVEKSAENMASPRLRVRTVAKSRRPPAYDEPGAEPPSKRLRIGEANVLQKLPRPAMPRLGRHTGNIAPSAKIEGHLECPSRVVIEPFARVRAGATIKTDVTIQRRAEIGRNACIGAYVKIGAGVHIPAGASVADGAVVDSCCFDGCFISPKLKLVLHGNLDCRTGVHFAAGADDAKTAVGADVRIGADVLVPANIHIEAGAVIRRISVSRNCMPDGTRIGGSLKLSSSARLGKRIRFGAETVIGRQCAIGDDVVLEGCNVIAPGIRIGNRAHIAKNLEVLVDIPDDARVDAGGVHLHGICLSTAGISGVVGFRLENSSKPAGGLQAAPPLLVPAIDRHPLPGAMQPGAMQRSPSLDSGPVLDKRGADAGQAAGVAMQQPVMAPFRLARLGKPGL